MQHAGSTKRADEDKQRSNAQEFEDMQIPYKMILQQEPYHQEQQQAGRLYNRITPINNSSINNNISSNDINEDCFYTPPKYGGGGGGLKKKYPLPPIALPLTSGSGGSGSGGRSGERPSRSEIHSILNHGIEIAMESDDDEEISYGDDYEEYNEWDLGTGHAIEEEKHQDEVDDVVQFCIPHQQQPRQSIQSQKLQRGGNGEGGALSSALYDYCDNNDNGVVICQTGTGSGVGSNNKTCAQDRRRTNFLAPILEERQVTFAAQHVVSRTRGSCNELKMVHTVIDAISVWFIPHYTEYTQNESAHMWYTQNEMHAMKDNYLSELAADTAAAKAKKQQCKKQVCQLFSLLCSPKTTSSSDTGTDNNGDTTDTDFYTDEFHHCRRCRYETSLCAVLNEQYEQRLMCQQVYGRVDNGYSGILDPDQLALVYTTLGDTKKCQRIAVEHSITTITDIDSPRATRVTTTAAAAADGSNNNNNNSNSLSTSTSSLSQKPSTCFFTISSGFNTCIDSLFQVLLTPILELRPKGDIFLGIGEEMHLS
ncbi:hypothetical protein FRACYDRAFT_247928 [Fragilariopsis cylindrus CCMP1102]|uniref:Uncharacterized protein n=1 Tax=Fragilariopsis cylindrus CCMP1102 TaxID=635003 RepID=A0A1E7EUV8_9STRA|nr:hypothetical protein FRACYDRAFT_247928 [Fragilariopsis cylindrus CCMP1102]|eukprot:OEU09672.1 hypothetical protein FRACYDRAFT_247928 [Fragilariopsis cylindrus CCMP1102]